MSNTNCGLISVIIPMYNAEKYVDNVFKNLFQQTYKNFEVIVAYDTKSTDNTLSKLHEIHKRHANIPIIIDIDCDTSSGAARNRGLKLARGEYVVFVDADDEFLPEYLSSFLKVYDRNPELDVVCCNRLCVKEKDISRSLFLAKEECRFASVEIFDKITALHLKITSQISNGPWAYMIRRLYLVENGIVWPDYSIRDDYVFTTECMEYTDKLGYWGGPTYLYILHPVSLLHQDYGVILNKFSSSHRDISTILSSINDELFDEFKLRESPLIVAGMACKYSYSEFRKHLKMENIGCLYQSKYPTSLTKRFSISLFNVSKLLYYYLARCLNVITNHLPISRIWSNNF
ncbi:MAG: glycosyltransferase [Clostridium lundense]|nr:glycosyltransferase [Clostridium lundense]